MESRIEAGHVVRALLLTTSAISFAFSTFHALSIPLPRHARRRRNAAGRSRHAQFLRSRRRRMQIELTSFNEFVVRARAIEPRQRDRLPRLSVSSDCKLDPTTIFSRRSPAFITSRLSSFTLFFLFFFFLLELRQRRSHALRVRVSPILECPRQIARFTHRPGN